MKSMTVIGGLARGLIVALVALSVSGRSHGAQRGAPACEPRTNRSESGEFELDVDPSSRHGAGPARYGLRRQGKEVWSSALPLTLWEAVVADDGCVAGYAYDTGADGFPVNGGSGVLHLLLLALDGTVRLDCQIPRDEPHHMHALPKPEGMIPLIDTAGDRVIFRILHGTEGLGEEWIVHRMSTGERLHSAQLTRTDPESQQLSLWSHVRLVRGTPLVLQWRLGVRGPNGARFTLLDAQANPVWSFELPGDYEIEEPVAGRILDRVRERSVILDVREERRFAVASVASSQSITFEVQPDPQAPSGWTVREIGRQPHDYPIEDAKLGHDAPLEPFELESLGAFDLAGALPDAGRLTSIDVDAVGRIGVVRSHASGGSQFEWTTPEGRSTAVVELQLPVVEAASRPQAVWLSGERWLVHRCGFGQNAVAEAWWLDLPSGKLSAIDGFESGGIQVADGTGEGGFVALTEQSLPYTIATRLCVYGADGAAKILGEVAYGQSEQGLLSPEGVCFVPTGEIAIVDCIRDEIQRFDRGGARLGTLRLEEVLGHEAGYPTRITADLEGNWIVYDSSNGLFLHVSREGRLLSECSPRFADGRELRPEDGLVVGPDGAWWTTDGHAVLQLDPESGVVVRVVGESPQPLVLGEIGAAHVDALGRLLVADRRTSSVHVFDRSGKRAAVCAPDPALLGDRVRAVALTTDADGRIYVGLGSYNPSKYVAFTSAGLALGAVAFAGQTFVVSSLKTRWELAYNEIRLRDESGTEVRKIQRTPSNKWIQGTPRGAVAPDGSLVVTAEGLSFFSSSGEPRFSIPLPRFLGPVQAYSGTHVFSVREGRLTVLDVAGRKFFETDLESALSPKSSAVPLWNAQAGELWVLDPEVKRVLRYRISD